MKICEPTYFSEFNCIADRCTDTCCRYWQVELDAESYNTVSRYKKILNLRIKGKDDNSVIIPLCSGNCPFLDASLLCNLYKDLGHDSLPYTCRVYPRFYNTIGGYEERGLSFSCPTAAELIYNNEIHLTDKEDDTPILNYTDVDADRFIAVKGLRNRLLTEVNSSGLDLKALTASIIEFADKAEKALKNNNLSYLTEIHLEFPKNEFVYSYKLFRKSVVLHLSNNVLRPEWKDMIKNASFENRNEDPHSFKTWFTYFIFRYMIRSLTDLEFGSVIKAGILSYYFISTLGMEHIKGMQLYSKETEHNERNIKRLFSVAKNFHRIS